MIKNNTIIEQLNKLPLAIKQLQGKHFAPMLLEPTADGKTNKRPLNIKNGTYLKWSNKDNLYTLAEAYHFMARQTPQNQQRLRLGLLLEPKIIDNQDIIVIDIDHRPDLVEQAKQGNITNTDVQAQVVKFAFKFNFYVEVSQSGEGLHLIQLGHKHNSKLIRNSNFEYYDSSRWICLTGNAIAQVDDNFGLGLKPEIFEKVEKMMFPNAEKKPTKPSSSPQAVTSSDFTDEELYKIIKKAESAQNGEKFKALFKGEDIQDVNKDSSAGDQVFANMLAFWTNKNLKMMNAIFELSGRNRSKWNEVHYATGETYGEHTLNNAIDIVDTVYTPKKKFDVTKIIDKSQIKTTQDLINSLLKARKAWDMAHTKDGKTALIASQPTEIIDILLKIVNFAKIYTLDSKKDRKLYFYDYDKGIYSSDETDLESLILAVAPEVTVTKTRQNILDTILKLPISSIPTVQNFVKTEKGRNLLAVGNGLLNLNTKQLTPFSPDMYVTSKIATDYKENANQEPTYNNWSWSRSLKVIGDGDLDKIKLLWQVCKASIIGAWWLRQAVLLVDDGHGMTGKSTFEDALTGVVGAENIAPLRLSEINDETKLVSAVDKKLIVGDDNDVYTIINRFDYLNPVISSELIRVRNYYQQSQPTELHAFILQSCNGLPPFRNATQAFFNRLKIIKFNHRHNAHNAKDWAVKNDYIKRPEFKEWLLWYVVNNVQLEIGLANTSENKNLIEEAQFESDSIKNFVENWLPDLESTVIPVPWLYDYYATTCVIDNIDNILPQKSFSRELQNNDLFNKKWDKKQKRLNVDTFRYSDIESLVDLYNSTRWGKDLKTWFPITSQTVKDSTDSSVSTTRKLVTKEDYQKKIKSYHSWCFCRN